MSKSAVVYPQLDFIRSVAVSLVFFGHLALTLGHDHGMSSAAHVGVLIFFVHTCLVLFLSLERLGEPGFGLFARFYIRRAFRIYPLSILTVLTVVVLHLADAPWGRFLPPDLMTLLSNLALTQNLTNCHIVLITLWSLPYEVQMYVILPFLYVLCTRWKVSGLVVWSVTFVAVGSLFHDGMSRAGEILRFVPCFCGGIVAYSSVKKPFRADFKWMLLFMAITIPLYLVARPYIIAYYWLDAVTCLLIGTIVGISGANVALGIAKICAIVARYSYGIYLVHLPLMWLLMTPARSMASKILFWPAMAILPVVLYHFVEHPLIGVGARLSRGPSPVSASAPPPDSVQLEAATFGKGLSRAAKQ